MLVLGNSAHAAEISVDIPYERFVLDNGLTLIVHEDRKAPVVAVNVWYHVGSKNEKRGKTGFAHLFEHLMFNGSENYNFDYFKAMEPIGATSLNGTTNFDRTNYFQTVPTAALDQVLFLESDRMGHLLGAIDQPKLDEQRGVVQNEKRQGENRPYGSLFRKLLPHVYPFHHPYSWSTIGSMEDLDAASLEDVHEWFQTYYGAANATIVLAGDISPEDALERVTHFFGDIPPGPPVTRAKSWVAKRTGTQKLVIQENVPQVLVIRVWNVPGYGEADNQNLRIAGAVLSDGKSSRLHKRLVLEEGLATQVGASPFSNEIGGLFLVQVFVKPGEDAQRVESILDEELARFIDGGPTREELERVRAQATMSFVSGAQRVGGFGGKSDLLAMGQTYLGRPDYYQEILSRLQSVSREEVRESAEMWLTDGDLRITVEPRPPLTASTEKADRSSLPEPGDVVVPTFPEFERATLANGLEVILLERDDLPLVQMRMETPSGHARDPVSMRGLAGMTLNMMEEGTKKKSGLEISEELANLGSELGVNFNNDTGSLVLTTLSDRLEDSLEIFADVIVNPTFPDSELGRLTGEALAGIEQEKANPNQLGLRIIPPILYGADHPYGQPGTGSGTVDSIPKITRADLVRFHGENVVPNASTLIVVGDTTMAALKPRLESAFRNWKATDQMPDTTIPIVTAGGRRTLYLVDKPGAPSTVFSNSVLIPSAQDEDEIPSLIMNDVIGGSFTSRINMNLREEKHWSYGSRSRLYQSYGQGVFSPYATVQTDKTAESIKEVMRELDEYVGEHPATEAEVQNAQQRRLLGTPGSYESIGAVSNALSRLVKLGLPDDYYRTYFDKLAGVSASDVHRAAERYIKPEDGVWFVFGDKEKIGAGICELDLENFVELDADGNEIGSLCDL